MNGRRQSFIKFASIILLPAFAFFLTVDQGFAQARRPAPPYEYKNIPGTNWITLFDGKSLEGWLPLELGGSGQVEFEKGFVPAESKADPVNIIRIGQGDMLSGMAWTNGPIRMNYEIEFEAMRLEGYDFFSSVSFPVKDSYVTFVPGGWSGNVTGISSVNKLDASENETAKRYSYKDNTWYHFKIKVSEKKIEAWVNDEKVVNLLTMDKELSLRSGSPAEINKYGLVFTTFRSTGAIKEIKMRKFKE